VATTKEDGARSESLVNAEKVGKYFGIGHGAFLS
jgi:hypothetical protein